MANYPVDVTLNYNHYTLQNRRLMTELLPQTLKRKVGVLNAAPFAQRLLTHVELPAWHPADAETREVCRQAVLYCHDHDVNPAKLCVQFSTSCPELTTCVIGTGSADNVRDWVRWLGEPYEAKAIQEVQEILAPVLDRNSIYGKPENNDPVSASENSIVNFASKNGVAKRVPPVRL